MMMINLFNANDRRVKSQGFSENPGNAGLICTVPFCSAIAFGSLMECRDISGLGATVLITGIFEQLGIKVG